MDITTLEATPAFNNRPCPSQNEGMAVLIGELQATCGQVSLIQL